MLGKFCFTHDPGVSDNVTRHRQKKSKLLKIGYLIIDELKAYKNGANFAGPSCSDLLFFYFLAKRYSIASIRIAFRTFDYCSLRTTKPFIRQGQIWTPLTVSQN